MKMRKFKFNKKDGSSVIREFPSLEEAEIWGKEKNADEVIVLLDKHKEYDR